MRAQTGTEERLAEEMYAAHNEDDRILQACLRVRSETGRTTVLYTNDRNLANKSIISGIDAYRLVNLEKLKARKIESNLFISSSFSSVALIPGIQNKMELLKSSLPRRKQTPKEADLNAGSREDVGQVFQFVASHIYLMT